MSLGSLRAKLTAWSAMMVGIVMVASGAGALALIRYDHFAVLDDLLRAEASIFFHELHLRPNALDQPQPEQVRDLLANSGPSRFVEIVDAKGEPIYKSNNLGEASLPRETDRPQTVNVAATRVRLRAFHDGQVTLLLGANLHDDDEGTQKLELAILCGLPILIGVVSLSGWWLARKALAPIHDITAAVERITAGRLDQRLPIPGTGDDVGRLASVLNDTFDRLD
ncbi:MAG TPA: HAMP domain-containing protein, partial [Chthoniobacteraceae bacterium]